MTENNKKGVQKNASSDIVLLISKKVVFFEDVIQKTILHVQKNKMLDNIKKIGVLTSGGDAPGNIQKAEASKGVYITIAEPAP